jgi:hypothetical protein
MRRIRNPRYAIESLERKLSPSDLIMPAAEVMPSPADGGDQVAPVDYGSVDDGSGYPGDFPTFVPIYPVEVGPAGSAF